MNLTDLMNRAYQSPTFTVENDILAAAAAEREADAKRAAVSATKGLLEMFEGLMRQNVEQLRALRRQEKMQGKLVSTLDRALRYFGQSGNPLPAYKALGMTGRAADFCRMVGIPLPANDDAAWNVPEDFAPDAPAVE